MSDKDSQGTVLTVIAVILLAILGLVAFQVVQNEQEPDNAVEALGQSIEDAGDQMSGAAEDFGDSVEDATDGN